MWAPTKNLTFSPGDRRVAMICSIEKGSLKKGNGFGTPQQDASLASEGWEYHT